MDWISSAMVSCILDFFEKDLDRFLLGRDGDIGEEGGYDCWQMKFSEFTGEKSKV